MTTWYGHPPRQAQERAARRHERPLDLRDPELGARGGHDQVARERHLEPAGHREALDRGDDGLRGPRRVMPAKPRVGWWTVSPRTNAPRSMPAQKKPPAPVRTATDSSGSASSRSSASPTPWEIAASTALRTCGRFSVMSRTPPRRSVRTAGAAAASVVASVSVMAADPIRGRPPPCPA
jgi:hypothetical protein